MAVSCVSRHLEALQVLGLAGRSGVKGVGFAV